MNDTYTINVPKHIQDQVGAAQSVVVPIHTVSQSLTKDGLVRVYEPRRDCEYWVKNADIYPRASKRW